MIRVGLTNKLLANKIAWKLTFYFAIALLVFALVVGAGFRYFFRQHTEELKKAEMGQRAVKIAQALQDSRERMLLWQEEHPQHGLPNPMGMGGKMGMGMMSKKQDDNAADFYGMSYGTMLRFLNSAAADDVWVVDEVGNLQMQERTDARVRHHENRKLTYKDLPPAADEVIKAAFAGEIAYSQGFSELLAMPTMTVGAPIRDAEGKVLGVVLLHSPLSGMQQATAQGLKLLWICGGVALVLAFCFSLIFSWRFTQPLMNMKKTAEKMTEGDYSVRTGVQQDDEIGQLGAALDILGEKLEAASQESAKLEQLRRDFIANISHELRTPVTVIRGSLEALVDKVVTKPEQVADYHEQMLKESLFLQRLINDLLDLSRLQNMNFNIEKTPLNLVDVLQDVARSSQRIAQAKNIKIELLITNAAGEKFVPDLGMNRPVAEESIKATQVSLGWNAAGFLLLGDYGRLRQMLMIFLDNAIKFSPSEGVVQLAFDGKTIVITDRGIGVDPKDLPYIFERFYKTRVEKNKNGTGLGLAIAREIAERHGMQVTMLSQPQEKTQVIIKL